MIDLKIFVEKSTRKTLFTNNTVGVSGENLQSNLVFEFTDEFVDGTGWLEYETDKEKGRVLLSKIDNTYQVPIKNKLLVGKYITMNLVITEGTDEKSIPKFKSNQFFLRVLNSVDYEEDMPDEYPTWKEEADVKFNQIDSAILTIVNLTNEIERKIEAGELNGKSLEFNWDGTQLGIRVEGQQEYQYVDLKGEKGEDALINGVKTIEIKAGENTKIRQEDNKLYIDSEAGYDDTEIKQEINNLDIEVGNLTENINEVVRTKADKSTTYTKNEVNDLIGNIKTTHFEVVEDLPEIGVENIIYLVPKQEEEFDDIYYEYIWVNNQYELIGTTQTDLSGYLTTQEYEDKKYDYVKDGLVNNTNELTEEEKTKIEEWLGLSTSGIDIYYFYDSTLDGTFYFSGKKKGIYVNREIINDNLFYALNKTTPKASIQFTPAIIYVVEELDGIPENDTTVAYAFGYNKNSGTFATFSMKVTKTGSITYYNNDSKAKLVIEKAQKFYGVKTFDVLPKSSKTPIDDDDLTNKLYVDTVDNQLKERISEIELFKFPNMIIHGEPTINNGQVSNFSTSNYLSFPAVFNLHDRGFEFNFAIRTGDNITTPQNILGSNYCMALLIENSKLKLKVSQNGTNWDLVDIESNVDLQANTTYYIQIYFDKLTYKLKYSTDGISYTEIASKVASVSPHPSQIYLGVGNNFHNPFGGIVNLNRCNLKINNSIVWAGMDTSGIETRLSTTLENIDEVGIEYINSLIDAKIGDIDTILQDIDVGGGV